MERILNPQRVQNPLTRDVRHMMKPYILATLLCVVLAPILGATIIGTLTGNPICIFWPGVLPVAFIAEGIPALLFGALGSFLIYRSEKRNRRITGLHLTVLGSLFGILAALTPLLLVVQDQPWTIGRGVLLLLFTGATVGIVCAWLAYRVIRKTKHKNGEPAGGAYVSPAAGDPSAHP